MSFRPSLYAVAFGLTLAPQSATSQESVQGSESAADTNTSQQAEPKPPSFVSALDRIETAIRDLIREESEEERKRVADQATKDLEAQTQMAEWAMEVALAAIASAFLTFGGLILIWRTLHHTKIAAGHAEKMVCEARKTTAQAVKQTQLAQDTYNFLESPYLAVKAIDATMLHSNQGGTRAISYNISNFGRRPAVVIAIRHHLGRLDQPGPQEEFYEVIGPGGELNNKQHVALNHDDAASLTQDDRIVFTLHISYLHGAGVRIEVVWKFVKNGSKPFTILTYHQD